MSDQDRNRQLIGHSGWLLAGVALLAASQARATSWEFEPTLEVGESYTDNVALTGSDEDSEFITDLSPGLIFRREAAQFQTEGRYFYQQLWYADNSEYNDHFHNFDGRANAQFLNEALTVDATAAYDQQTVDPEGAVGFSNLLRTGNRTDVGRATITPAYFTTIAPHFDTYLTYSYSMVDYRNTEDEQDTVDDSHRHFVRAIVGDLQEPGRIDWQANYQYSRTEFDGDARSFKYSRAGGQIGYAINPRTRLLFGAGRESDVEKDVSAGNLDAGYWDVGVNWIPNRRQSLEARVGERYFGTSYFFAWKRQTSRTTLDASYTEEAVTANDALFVLDPGAAPPGYVGVRLDSDVYIRKRFTAGYQVNFSRNRLDLAAWYEDRDYQVSDRDSQDVSGLSLGWTFDLGPRTKLNTQVTAEQRQYEGDDDIYRFRVNLDRQLTRILEARLSLGRLVRNTESGSEDYRANGAAVYLAATF